MPFGYATHGIWCNTRTWPTRCKYCGDKVFYFTCNCGSKVFYNHLGKPWPIHYCDGYLNAQRTAWNVISRIGDKISDEYSSGIVESYKSGIMVKRLESKRRDPESDETVTDTGQVRESIKQVDVYKKFRINERTSLSSAFLGELAQNDFAQMTVHVGDLSRCDTKSYTFLVERKLLRTLNVERFDIVDFKLHSYVIPGVTTVWLCDYIGPAL